MNTDKKYEDILINRLVTVVGQRNDIVDCLENDRLRALDEDMSIDMLLEEFDDKKENEDSCHKVSQLKQLTDKKCAWIFLNADRKFESAEAFIQRLSGR